MQVSGKAGHTTGKDLTGLGRELPKEVGVLKVDCVCGDVEATAGHASVGAAEVATALFCLWCAHVGEWVERGRLLGLAMECVALEIWIVLLFLKSARSVEALLVSGRDVAGDGLAFGNRFGALNNDDVAWHKTGIVDLVGLAGFGGVVLFALGLFFSQSEQ